MKKKKELSKIRGTNETGISGSFYVTAGEKCKVIGLMDGTFPDFGHHLRNEMGGVWMHPIKAADGFYLKCNDKFLIAEEYETLPYGNRFFYDVDSSVKVIRTQISPDQVRGVILQYEYRNQGETVQEIKDEFILRFDILPVWFSEENGIHDFEDVAEFDLDGNYIVAKDGGHDWYAVLGCDFPLSKDQVTITKEHIAPVKSVGKGISASISNSFTLQPGEHRKFTYYITASEQDKKMALDDFRKIRKEQELLIAQKKARYQEIKNRTDLTTSEKEFNDIFLWVKYNTDWLISDCGSYGKGLTAGLPEYPWWFGCDSAYSIQGLLAMGEFETARQTLVLLWKYSEKYNGNGRILHEITTFGMNAHSGNSQETGHYITALYHYLKWTGDIKTVEEIFPYCEKGIEWLLTEMDSDGDLLPSGYGIIEIEGLNVELIDTAVYTCQALFCMAEIALLLKREHKDYNEKAERLKTIINTRLWDENEKLYVDAVGTPAQVLERMKVLLTQPRYTDTMYPSYKKYLLDMKDRLQNMEQDKEIPFIINKNWVINVPMETGIADKEKAMAALKTMHSEDFIGEYGIYLSGFMHGNTMTISTGVQAVAEGRYGRSNESLDLLNRMFRTFSATLPGSINEMSPDYGCFAQAWTAYAVMVPVVEYFAGIHPRMQENKVIIEPCVPDKWNHMHLSNVKVGKGSIGFSYQKEMGTVVYEINVEGLDQVELRLKQKNICLHHGKNVIEVKGNYEAIIFDLDGVLCHTDEYHYRAWKAVAERIGVPFDKEINHRLRGVSRMESLDIILEQSHKTYTKEEKEFFAEEKNNQYKELLNSMTEKELSVEVKETLDFLKNAEIKLAIGSSSKNAPVILERLGLSNYFDAISDGNHITKSKPDPEVFIKAAEYLSISPKKCLVVEDAEAGIQAAKAASMDCAAIGDLTECHIASYDLNTFSELKDYVQGGSVILCH